jgi:hypothetical protein
MLPTRSPEELPELLYDVSFEKFGITYCEYANTEQDKIANTKKILVFINQLLPVLSHRPIGFCFEFVICLRVQTISNMPTKKAWHFFAFIGFLEVFDYLILPITTSKAHAFWRERRCFTPGGF